MKLKQILLSLFVTMFMLVGSGWAGDAVNINSGTAKELRQVEGIGTKIAARIIAYRDQHGPFNSVDDLLQIKGFGKKTLAKAKDELTVDDEEND